MHRIQPVALTVAAFLIAQVAQAAYTESFTALRAELSQRAGALTGSVDKAAQKQGKACVKAIVKIDKSLTLAADVKTAGKLSKALAKAFPEEFIVIASRPAAPAGVIVLDQNLSDLLDNTFSNLVSEIQAELDALQLQIDALPNVPGKTNAQTILDNAQILLDSTWSATDYNAAAKAMASTLKGLASGLKAVASALNSGGSGGGAGLSCKINGASFSALGAVGTYVNLTGQFTITGATASKAVTIIAFDVIGPGTYAAGGGTQYQDIAGGTNYISNVTGTVQIATINLAQGKATGTFTFSVTQTTPSPNPENKVEILDGTFNVSGIVSF